GLILHWLQMWGEMHLTAFVETQLTIFLSPVQGNLTIPKEVNRKKNNETEAAFLTPANGYGYHFIEINYLYPF
uniref:Neuronal regeneration-related protein n=1 Tax=Chrysemys picta bellii TaxID=8478 RepID=A0A8C3P6E5_CHRPI